MTDNQLIYIPPEASDPAHCALVIPHLRDFRFNRSEFFAPSIGAIASHLRQCAACRERLYEARQDQTEEENV